MRASGKDRQREVPLKRCDGIDNGQDPMISSSPHLMEHERSPIPRKEIFLAGMASLVLHALAILLVITAVAMHSVSGKAKKAPGFSVSLVNLSSPVSGKPVQQPGNRIQGLDSSASEVKKIQKSKSKSLGKPPDAPSLLDTEAVRKKTNIIRDAKVIAPAGSNPQSDGSVVALQATTPATAAGTAAKFQEGGSMSPGSAGENDDKREESRGTLRSAASRYGHAPLPVYPHIARQKGYEGVVLISVEILENGSPGQLLVKKSSGYAILDQAALNAVKKWKFYPAIKNNVRIRTWGDVPIRFVLQDSK